MDTQFIKKRFDEIAKTRKFSIRWLSESLKINRYSVNKILDGDVRNGRDEARLRAILAKLGFSEDQFFAGSRSAPLAATERTLIPMYGEIPAGHPTWFDGVVEPEDWISPPPGSLNRKLFALRVRGQSMSPRFQNGDTLYLEPLSIRLGIKDPKNVVPRLTFERLDGHVVAALVDGEATLKQLKVVTLSGPDDYELHLVPFNPEYEPIVIGPDSTADFQGVVVGLYRIEA